MIALPIGLLPETSEGFLKYAGCNGGDLPPNVSIYATMITPE
jgi:hypothetical protein